MRTLHLLSLSYRAVRPALRPLAWLTRAWALRRQRRLLADLPPEILRDIGVTPDDARAEATRPFWDAPAHWRL